MALFVVVTNILKINKKIKIGNCKIGEPNPGLTLQTRVDQSLDQSPHLITTATINNNR
jgi:hypothetical protein